LAQLMPGLDESLQFASEPARVLRSEINFVVVLVKTEADGLDTVFGAVEIVNKVGACHCGHTCQATVLFIKFGSTGKGSHCHDLGRT
jgi:hypothetical protein